MSTEDLLGALKHAAKHAAEAVWVEKEKNYIPNNDEIVGLINSFNKISDEETFETGDIVVWKPGLKNRRLPFYSQPMVVTKVYHVENAPINQHEDGTPLYMERLDLRLGYTDDDGEFMEYHFDSRRFTKIGTVNTSLPDLIKAIRF